MLVLAYFDSLSNCSNAVALFVFIISEFSANCTSYFPPLTYQCAQSIWIENGCLLDEKDQITRFENLMFPQLTKMNLRLVTEFFHLKWIS